MNYRLINLMQTYCVRLGKPAPAIVVVELEPIPTGTMTLLISTKRVAIIVNGKYDN